MSAPADANAAKPRMAINTPDWVRSAVSYVSSLMRSASFRPRACSRLRSIFASYNGRVETVDVIVGGGGIIGLSSALELARNGFRVRVIEKGRAMSEASWAAAGMLSANDPDHPTELAQLAALRIRLYPEYLSVIEGLSGRAVPVRTQATLVTSQIGIEFHPNETKVCPALSVQEAERRIPGLATDGRSFCWMEEPSLNPRDLCTALPLAAAAAGVELHQQTEVLAVTSRNSAVA